MTMTAVKTPIFIDTNVLIRLYVATAPQHAEVREATGRHIKGYKRIIMLINPN